jgi:hypothetical protein
MMIKLRLVLFGEMVIAASMSTAHAGPCSDAIDAMQARIDAKLEAKAAAGPTAKQGVAAGMSVQPTPASIAAAEEKVGKIYAEKGQGDQTRYGAGACRRQGR